MLNIRKWSVEVKRLEITVLEVPPSATTDHVYMVDRAGLSHVSHVLKCCIACRFVDFPGRGESSNYV